MSDKAGMRAGVIDSSRLITREYCQPPSDIITLRLNDAEWLARPRLQPKLCPIALTFTGTVLHTIFLASLSCRSPLLHYSTPMSTTKQNMHSASLSPANGAGDPSADQ